MRRLIILVGCAVVSFGAIAAEAIAGTVEGTVTPIEWAQEVEVCVVEGQPSEPCVEPEAGGHYVLSGLSGVVKLEFIPSYRSHLLIQYYDRASRLSEATSIVIPPEPKRAQGIDAELVEGGSILGTVTAAAGGQPLGEVEVCAVSVGLPVVRSCGETDPAGEYELHSLSTGSYTVTFVGQGRSAEYEPRGHPVVAVVAGNVAAGVDASLAVGAKIGGTVTVAAGGALPGVTVCLFTVTGATARQCTESGAGGAYGFVGLAAGSYQVGFSLGPAEIAGTGSVPEVGGFVPQYYAGASTRAQATTISLLPSASLEGVDAALATVPAPQPAAPTAAVTAPIVPAPPTVAIPTPKKTGCEKPKRKEKVKGKIRCLKPARKKGKRDGAHKQKVSHKSRKRT